MAAAVAAVHPRLLHSSHTSQARLSHCCKATQTPRQARGVGSFTQSRRNASSSSSAIGFTDVNQYHVTSEKALEIVLERMEEDDLDADGYDVEFSAGVLSIRFPDAGTFVLNKQAPNRQIWYSSPLSGPHHYNYHSDVEQWCSTKDESRLHTRLVEELSKASTKQIEFSEEF